MNEQSMTAEEQIAMQAMVRRLLGARCSEADTRRIMASEDGFDRELWKALGDAGLTGLIVAPRFGGIGAGPVELELIMEEAGAALLGPAFLSSAVLAAGLLSCAEDEATSARLLPAIASGERIATVALTGPTGRWQPEDVSIVARPSGARWTLRGTASFVTAANVADILLVVARKDDGLAGFEVDPNGSTLRIEPLHSFDPTMRLFRIEFDDTPATFIEGADAAAIDRMMDVARIALAGEQVGGARRIFHMTIDYVKSRVQFGRPVGGFQAIKHMAADLFLEVESATSAARAAAMALAGRRPDAPALINLAAFACADTFSQVAAQAIQMHGGIAFTWEHPAHLYLRRARADAQFLGSPSTYRERYLNVLETAA